ncbi:DUF423 domain-containing protein [Aurantimonas aggregata]|uniref:DUF423 domain-containing protein n=1 Tax=Aurantimonas aggregata TaxID=2047720 RepID=A0A6L9MDR1_9HYPH|nr:DUF423 domain-containing protein [Aurantimonas aggregata]NDV85788.1 DUF423 domain-containing protein [Aurantimonas aggregata]
MAGLLILFAGLFGAAGVAGAALAAHGGEVRLVATAAAIALVHAPALLGLAALRPLLGRWADLGGGVMIAGTLLFSGDLAARVLLGDRLFANAAPIGGGMLIAAWLIIAVSGLVRGTRAVHGRGGDDDRV